MEMNLQRVDTEKFRLLLQSELEKRRQKNPNYSLRAFAGQLNMHAACLSVLLKGKRPLTTKMIKRLVTNLPLSQEEVTTCIQ